MTRLDIALVELGLFDSREKAKLAIASGQVLVNGQAVTKASFKLVAGQQLSLSTEVLDYVSLGALKLLKAIEDFKLDFTGLRVLDVGASTGGFTEVALRQGATSVVAMDVGSNQLHPKLLADERVQSIENCHIRDFKLQHMQGQAADCLVTDLSFISLTQVFPYFGALLHDTAWVVALIKPQFEMIAREQLQNGIVREFKLHAPAIDRVLLSAQECGFWARTLSFSPVRDWRKNVEYLALFERQPCSLPNVKQCVQLAETEWKSVKRNQKNS